MHPSHPHHPRTAVIGAGISGLTVGKMLKDYGVPYTAFETSDPDRRQLGVRKPQRAQQRVPLAAHRHVEKDVVLQGLPDARPPSDVPAPLRHQGEARGSNATVRDIWDDARELFIEPIAQMIRHDRAAGLAPNGLDAGVLASILLEFNDRLLERLTLGGALSRQQLMDGGATVWLSTIYGITDSRSAQTA